MGYPSFSLTELSSITTMWYCQEKYRDALDWNVCRVMVEGPDADETQRFCQQIADVVKKTLG